MREFNQSFLPVFIMAAILMGITWVFGFSPNGLIYGQWPLSDDHPTNWYDTVLHPDAK
jgi:hypothetical protein